MCTFQKATQKVAFFLFISCMTLTSQSLSNLDFRGLWVVRGSMTSKEEIDRVLSFAKANQFNHLFLQVRGRGDAFYNSRIVKKSNLIRDPNFNPLEYAVRKGHSLGLKIHAWVNVYLIWSSDRFPKEDGHIFNQFPEWIDKNSLGKSIHSTDMANGNSSAHRFLSPAHPGVMNYLIKVFRELLVNYDIDGIHLDYIRYSDADFGYNMAARIEFERKYGIDPLRLFTSSGYGSSPVQNERINDQLQKWDQFRRDTVTDLVRKTNALILDINPEYILTAAVKPDPREAKKRFFQEWDRWIVEGLVDYVVPMNYTSDLREFAHVIDGIYDSIPNKYWPGIIMGIAVYNQNALNVSDKVRYTRVTGFSGVSIFSYNVHKDNPEFFIPVVEEMTRR